NITKLGDKYQNKLRVLNEALKQANEKILEEQDKTASQHEKIVAMSNVAGVVTHEIRNPLNAISMAMQRLESALPPAEQPDKFARLFDVVSQEIERLDDIIQQFLTFARAPVIETKKNDIVDCIKTLVTEFESLTDARNITLRTVSPAELWLQFDQNQIHQMLFNLINNAIDVCFESGQITIRVYDEGENVVLSVEDTGVGIAAEEQERIFDLYYTTKKKGTGLGLPIALRIVQAHHGSLNVSSEVNQGTTVTVRLPKE
ncbi:PAS domain-containing sensor histidine kinase, partial [candidate division CSSED10-310 bacterium]